jgi:uncharacterized protein YggE
MVSVSATERAMPIEPGTQDINIEVQVTWELK